MVQHQLEQGVDFAVFLVELFLWNYQIVLIEDIGLFQDLSVHRLLALLESIEY